MSAVEIRSRHRSFGGEVIFCSHESYACGGTMRFSAFLPPGEGPFPVFLWLSGLTCTEENFMVKAGAQKRAAQLGLAILAPDTSPRETGIAGEDDDWDLGSGAGFYVDATQPPWQGRYTMESWINDELPAVVSRHLPLDMGRCGVSGHSMGGHGALVFALRYPDRYLSVSAFAPISAPTRCPWGHKALGAYLGEDRGLWAGHDACALLTGGRQLSDLLVDQGEADPFLDEQLRTDLLEQACAASGTPLTLRRHEAYDHSYYFVASFIDDHLEWHARRLAA
ncbi:MAG: S-formylglutathione hydrolase [Gammaproteobacteria bacterium SG8_31]|jgi:S-formylglutathione hydrolase|nr:MAG: S-formylglutathione hydrolase [Gammaproteobacteria bacterium SG8_31]